MQSIFTEVLTPLNSVIIAFITVCGAMLFKRRFTLEDRRQKKDDRCDRIEVAYRIQGDWLALWVSTICQVAKMRLENRCDDAYVVRRVSEISTNVPPTKRLNDFIETGQGLEEGDTA